MKIKRLLSVFLLCVCLSALLAIPAQAADAPDIRAKAALLVDVNTDAVAYAQNIHEQNYPASLTKVMTALLILEKASGNDALLTQEVTAPESAFASPYYAADGSTAGIKAGEVLTVKQPQGHAGGGPFRQLSQRGPCPRGHAQARPAAVPHHGPHEIR